MNNHHTINDLLDQWVKNEITFDELAFRSGKEDLYELQENMEMHRLAVHAIQKHSAAVQVASIHEKYLSKRKEQSQQPVQVVSIQRSRFGVRLASAAAVFAVLLVAAQMFFVSSNRIYSEAFTEYYANNERGANAPVGGKIAQLFQKGDFKELLSLYRTGKEEYGNREIFMAGYAALVLKDYSTASEQFSTILNKAKTDMNSLFVDESEYYLALAQLRAGKHEEAYQLMRKIYSNPEHTYYGAFDKWTMLRMRYIK